MQLSGCTEKCKAGNSLKNGAKATGKARKRREGTEREAESRKEGSGPGGERTEQRGQERSKGSGRAGTEAKWTKESGAEGKERSKPSEEKQVTAG